MVTKSEGKLRKFLSQQFKCALLHIKNLAKEVSFLLFSKLKNELNIFVQYLKNRIPRCQKYWVWFKLEKKTAGKTGI